MGCAGGCRSAEVTEPGADTLPAASVRVTCRVLPSFTAGDKVSRNVPSAPTVPLAIRLPLASRTCTVVPASPLPLSCWPATPITRLVGASGGVVSGGVPSSGALIAAAPEVLPAASVAVTLKAWPSVCGGCKVTLNSPSAPAVAVPSKVPPGPRTCTVEPGSARPVRVVPWLLTANSLGGVGAVVSGAFSDPPCEVLPAASVAVTLKAWPLVCGGCSVTLNWPSAPAVAVPKRVPSAPRTCTVEPGSARPVRVVP